MKPRMNSTTQGAMFKVYFCTTRYYWTPRGKHLKDLDEQIAKLLLTTEPILMARAEKEVGEDDSRDNRDKDHAVKQVAVLHLSIKNTLERIYKITSHSFHTACSARQ
jgi:hypothetical protein